MSKTLVMIRHAHRDTSRRELDNGLDDKGREQAKAVKRFFSDRFGDFDQAKGLWLVSSPKLRCQETLLPIAKEVGRPVDVHPGLDEQSAKESSNAFANRIAGFFKEWAQADRDLTILCSHGDWLPLAAFRLLSLNLDLKKGSWFEIDWNGGQTTLKWYIPSFKNLYK
jgi:broad specificity phosphatase PhoE